MSTIEEIITRPAVKRYAELVAIASGAEEKIQSLTEAVEQSEWLRIQAEGQLSSITWPDDFPQVWHMGTDEPPAEVAGLIDLINGTPYVRAGNGRWKRLGVDVCIEYEWPIEDAGPFIALREEYGLRRLGRMLDQVIDEHDTIRRLLWNRPGYEDPDNSNWSRPGLAGCVARVLKELDKRDSSARSEIWELKQQVRKLTLPNREGDES
jgi:hypothetical protein